MDLSYCACHRAVSWRFTIDLFTDTAAVLISIVLNNYYGMPRGQIHINLPPEHPIMSFETIEIKMAAVSAKRSLLCFTNSPRDSIDPQPRGVSPEQCVGSLTTHSVDFINRKGCETLKDGTHGLYM